MMLLTKSIKIILMLAAFLLALNLSAQRTFKDSLTSYQQNYITTHEVVTSEDRKYIHFYDISESYRLTASFKKITDKDGFEMNTSSGKKQQYFIYGQVTFKLHGAIRHLFVYQSRVLMQQQKYKNYLFIPFGDATSGFESYGGGRYIDVYTSDIKNNAVVLDFNKAYNPYCAYTNGYDCPLPPKENVLTVPVYAGEKSYGKPIH